MLPGLISRHLAATILPLVVWILSPRTVHCQVQTVSLNPYESIPVIGDFLSGGDDDKPFKDRWTFWLVISIILAFLIVVAYFAFRGFRAYFRGKKAAAARAETEAANGDQEGAEITLENGENGIVDGIPISADVSNGHIKETIDARPSVTASDTSRPEVSVDVIELARRTGRKPQDAAITRVVDLRPF